MSIVFLPLYDDFLNVLKSSLASSLPNMKSSHRLEAFARAADYGSWASLLNAIKVGAVAYNTVSGERFMEFARSVGCSEEDPNRFFEAVLDAAAKISEAIVPSSMMTMRLGNVLDNALEGGPDEQAVSESSGCPLNATSSDPQSAGERTLIIAVVQEVVQMKPISEAEKISIIERTNTKIFARPTR